MFYFIQFENEHVPPSISRIGNLDSFATES
jgi:hypothetical protein